MLLRGSAEYHPAVKELQMLEMTGSKGTEDLPSPRVFNTHLRFRHLPKDMINRCGKASYLLPFVLYTYCRVLSNGT